MITLNAKYSRVFFFRSISWITQHVITLGNYKLIYSGGDVVAIPLGVMNSAHVSPFKIKMTLLKNTDKMKMMNKFENKTVYYVIHISVCIYFIHLIDSFQTKLYYTSLNVKICILHRIQFILFYLLWRNSSFTHWW